MLRRLLYGRILYPAYHSFKRDGINRAIRELAESQWQDSVEVATVRYEKLVRLLRFAAQHVPYYRRVIAELGMQPDALAKPEAFQQMPVLKRDVIRREGAQLQAAAAAGRRAYPNSTSGSTGEPLRFLTDAAAHAYRMADEQRGKTLTGYRIGEKTVALWGAPMDVGRAHRLRGRLHGLITGHRYLSSFELLQRRMDEYIRVIQRFGPRLLIAYPSALEIFARHCLERDIRFDSLTRGVMTSAETLWEYQRPLFEKAFGTPVFNRYGSREVGVVAHECTAHRGLHVSADRLLVEIVDERGRACPPGVWGELLITDLDSYAMPLIRYRIGDRAAWANDGPCPCGRRLPRLVGVQGRSMDVVRGPNGHCVGGTFWTILLRSRPGLKRFQVVQDESGTITIRYVAEPDLDRHIFRYFTREIQRRLGTGLSVRYESVDEIEKTRSGKHRLVISDYRPSRVPVRE